MQVRNALRGSFALLDKTAQECYVYLALHKVKR